MRYASVQLGVELQQSPPSPEMWASTVREIYANTAVDDKVRGLIITEALRNFNHLLETKDNAFSTMMLEVGEFGRDIARTVRFASDLQDEDFNPPLNEDDDPQLGFHCSSCKVYWKTFKKYTFGDANTLSCPKVGCTKTLDPLLDLDFTLLHNWECPRCWDYSLWSSDAHCEGCYRWLCPGCDQIVPYG